MYLGTIIRLKISIASQGQVTKSEEWFAKEKDKRWQIIIQGWYKVNGWVMEYKNPSMRSMTTFGNGLRASKYENMEINVE